MKNTLTTDEVAALGLLQRGGVSVRANACVGRNAKKLQGLKLLKVGRDDKAQLTDEGKEVLFLQQCVGAMRALAAGPGVVADARVAAFLGKKSHIVPLEGGRFELTAKGRESLADIDR